METFLHDEDVTTTTIDVLRTSSQIMSKQRSGMITDEAVYYIDLFILNIMGYVLTIAGVITNLLNVLIFWKQGTKESVNVTFIFLSVWDLSNSVLSALTLLCFVIETYFPVPKVNFISLQYVYIGYTRGFAYILSTLVTVYLSIERCICIMSPFKVKGIFTKERVFLINLAIFLFGFACFCPAWSSQGMQWVFDPSSNMTLFIIWLSLNRREIDIFVDTFNGIAIPLLAQILISVSAGLMIHGVQKMAKFRHKSTGSKIQSNISGQDTYVSKFATTDDIKKNTVMADKDVKLTKVVILVALIFFTCNLPVFGAAITRALVPEVDLDKSEKNVYKLLYCVVYLSSLINGILNTFAYYYVSSKYRQVFLKLIGRIK